MPDDLPPWERLPTADRPTPAEASDRGVDRALRWRMALGRHAEEALPVPEGERRRDALLGQLYDRVFAERAPHRVAAGGGEGFDVPRWLGDVRRLFPEEASRVLEADALHRFGLTELLTDPEVLRSAEPSEDLLRAILAFKDRMEPPVLEEARRVVAEVVEQLRARFEVQCAPAVSGRARGEGAPRRTFRNVDWHRTIRGHLARWDGRRLAVDAFRFHRRERRRSPWRVVIAVDQSGSMSDSLVHASIMAAVLAAAPAVTVNLLLWDHRVLDVSDQVADPLAVLMGTQLGGGTRMLPALRAAAERVTEPSRTLLVVVSDFFVSEARGPILELAAELRAAGVRCVGLCSLDDGGRPTYDEGFARALVEAGWRVGAMTPRSLAELVG